MIWKLTVLSPDERDVLFVGNTRVRAEIEACAAEAARMRPDCVVLVTSPFGEVSRIGPPAAHTSART